MAQIRGATVNPSALLDELDDEQRRAAMAVAGPVLVVAGAGTGKTRTVTYRLAHGIGSGQVDGMRALAVTHSRKAAAELKERLGRLGAGDVDTRTFHAAGLRVASRFWDHTGRSEAAPNVISDGEAWRIWRDSVRAVTGSEPDVSAVRDVSDEVAWARSRLVEPDLYPAAASLADRQPGMDAKTIVKCWEAYDRTKARIGRVDFADLLDIAASLVEHEADVAEKVRNRWAYVTVDEYQDTDPAQQRLLDAVVGDGDDICVVGDPRQAIYSWKGADPTYLTGFTKRYPAAQVFDLTRNYRSSAQILSWANSIASKRSTKPLVATCPPGSKPKITQLDTEGAEAAWVVGAARRAIAAGTPASEIAVLYRFNATQARFEAAFARAGIPTVVAEDATYFDRPEIRSVLVPFGQAARARPEDDGLLLLTSVMTRNGFDRDSPPDGQGAARARWESLSALLELVEAMPDGDEPVAPPAGALLTQINKLATSTLGPRDAGVTLATLHRAKGLEWDVVFVVGVTDGAVPSTYATTPAQIAEEERLLHVGITRARRELHLTWPAASGRGWATRPSPFFDLLPGGPPTAGTPLPRAAVRGDRTSRGRAGGSGRAGGRSEKRSPVERISRGSPEEAGGAYCPHCTEPLRGVAARRLGVCADCVTSTPGEHGRRARALADVITSAAEEAGRRPEDLVSPAALMRLLHRRPLSADAIGATAGVDLPPSWAAAAADALQD